MSWENILKLKKYSIQEVKDVFLNRETIDYGFKDAQPTLIEQYLFYYIYFNEPLPSKVRIECKRFAAKANNPDTATFLNNLSIAGGKIIANAKSLPFSKDEVIVTAPQARHQHTSLRSMTVHMDIYLSSRPNYIYIIELDMRDGLYAFEIKKTKYGTGHREHMFVPSLLKNNIPFITKVLDEYNPRVRIFEHGEYESSWQKRNTNIEEVIDEIEYMGDRL